MWTDVWDLRINYIQRKIVSIFVLYQYPRVYLYLYIKNTNLYTAFSLFFYVAKPENKPEADPWFLQQTGKQLVKVRRNGCLWGYHDWYLWWFDLVVSVLSASRKTEWAAVYASCSGGDCSWGVLQSGLLLPSGTVKITVLASLLLLPFLNLAGSVCLY